MESYLIFLLALCFCPAVLSASLNLTLPNGALLNPSNINNGDLIQLHWDGASTYLYTIAIYGCSPTQDQICGSNSIARVTGGEIFGECTTVDSSCSAMQSISDSCSLRIPAPTLCVSHSSAFGNGSLTFPFSSEWIKGYAPGFIYNFVVTTMADDRRSTANGAQVPFSTYSEMTSEMFVVNSPGFSGAALASLSTRSTNTTAPANTPPASTSSSEQPPNTTIAIVVGAVVAVLAISSLGYWGMKRYRGRKSKARETRLLAQQAAGNKAVADNAVEDGAVEDSAIGKDSTKSIELDDITK